MVFGAAANGHSNGAAAAPPPGGAETLSVPLLDFVTGAWQQQPQQQYVVVAVLVPLPAGPGARFWSQRIAQRYSNAAAVANVAVWAQLWGGGDDGLQRVEAVRVAVGMLSGPPPPTTKAQVGGPVA